MEIQRDLCHGLFFEGQVSQTLFLSAKMLLDPARQTQKNATLAIKSFDWNLENMAHQMPVRPLSIFSPPL
jgi:hypothetical protein